MYSKKSILISPSVLSFNVQLISWWPIKLYLNCEWCNGFYPGNICHILMLCICSQRCGRTFGNIFNNISISIYAVNFSFFLYAIFYNPQMELRRYKRWIVPCQTTIISTSFVGIYSNHQYTTVTAVYTICLIRHILLCFKHQNTNYFIILKSLYFSSYEVCLFGHMLGLLGCFVVRLLSTYR